MTLLTYLVIYAGAAAFAGACCRRAFTYARLPVHLRWELYPVPHEPAERVEHGGSYFEAGDWWTLPRRHARLRTLRFMLPEMLLLKGLWEYNRRMWYRSFPFHFGLYVLAGTGTCLGLGAALAFLAPGVPAVLSTPLWHACLRCAGYGGTLLVVGGAVALMIFRLREPGLRSYTTPGDILNLAAFAVTLSVLGLGCLFRRPADPDLPVIARGLLAFDLSVRIPGLVAAGLIMSSLLAAYVPLTHMSHFIAKFFTYHAVRWDDAPLVRGGKLEVRIAEYLTYRPAWAASHVGADGSKTWADIARSRPAGEVRK